MRLCQLFSKRATPFLLGPVLSVPVAAATWFVTRAAGAEPLVSQLAAAGAFLAFAVAVTIYVVHCLNRYSCS